MKRKDWIEILERNGWYFLRSGGNHDIYTNGKETEPVGRHTELNETLIKKIMKRRGFK